MVLLSFDLPACTETINETGNHLNSNQHLKSLNFLIRKVLNSNNQVVFRNSLKLINNKNKGRIHELYSWFARDVTKILKSKPGGLQNFYLLLMKDYLKIYLFTIPQLDIVHSFDNRTVSISEFSSCMTSEDKINK